MNSAATFHVTADLLPGASKLDLRVSCDDIEKAFPIPAIIMEDESGWLSAIYPMHYDKSRTVKRYELDDQNMYETRYWDITNSHPTDNVTITVVASALALQPGTHTCKLKLNAATSPVDLVFEAVALESVSRLVMIELLIFCLGL